MKRIVYAAALAAVLAGCGLAPAKFDPVEQLGYAALWQQAAHLRQECSDGDKVQARVGALYEISELLGAYVQYQDDTGSRELMLAFDHLLDDANPTSYGRAFCEESANNLQDAAIRAMQVNGARQR